MTNMYLSSSLMWGSNEKDIVTRSHAFGFEGIELWVEQLSATNLDIYKFAKLAQQHDLSVCLHAKSWDLNFASICKETRESSTNAIIHCIDVAEKINVSEVTVHPPRATITQLKDLSMEFGKQELEKIVDYAKRRNVQISLEIMEKISKELVTTPKEYHAFVGNMHSVLTTTIDIAHCFDEVEFWEYTKVLENFSKIHLSNKIGKKLHTPLDEGDFDFNKLMPLLLELNKPIVLEGFDNTSDYNILRQNINFLESLKEKVKC